MLAHVEQVVGQAVDAIAVQTQLGEWQYGATMANARHGGQCDDAIVVEVDGLQLGLRIGE